MEKNTANWPNCPWWYSIFMLLLTPSLFAQSDSLDYSHLKFESLYNYYQQHRINIIDAYNPDLYFEIYEWLHTPYRWGGHSKSGVDCSGFVSHLHNKFGKAGLSGSCTDIFNRCEEIDTANLVEGDLVFFNIRGKRLSHVGIYLQHGRFAHATVHGGVMVNSLDEKYYRTYFYKAARLK